MKVFLSCERLKLLRIGTHLSCGRCPKVITIAVHTDQQTRCIHESYLPKGKGGRSSFSGVVATVFGGNGFLGLALLNHLGAYGTNVMIPYRGTFDRVQRMRTMSDLGQFMFRENFSIQQGDDVVRDLIEHSNCVINLIKAWKPYNHYTMEEVNVEWPRRLANLVAEKGDGTKLIHVTHLNCHQQEGRNVSNILRQDYQAENEMREIYPPTTIVRCSNIHGYFDNFTFKFFNKRFFNLGLALSGAAPVMYDGGKSTIIQPVFVSDVAEGITRLTKHPDAAGHTFEFLGPDRFTLHDYLEHAFETRYLEYYPFNTIGPLDRSKATWHQKLFHKVVEFYFWKMFQPRLFMPRFLDLLTRGGGRAAQWMTFDHFKQLHITDRTTGAAGLGDLGIEPCPYEEKAFEYLIPLNEEFQPRSGKMIPKTGPEIKEPQTGKQIAHLST